MSNSDERIDAVEKILAGAYAAVSLLTTEERIDMVACLGNKSDPETSLIIDFVVGFHKAKAKRSKR
jgi:hypothetical protein